MAAYGWHIGNPTSERGVKKKVGTTPIRGSWDLTSHSRGFAFRERIKIDQKLCVMTRTRLCVRDVRGWANPSSKAKMAVSVSMVQKSHTGRSRRLSAQIDFSRVHSTFFYKNWTAAGRIQFFFAQVHYSRLNSIFFVQKSTSAG